MSVNALFVIYLIVINTIAIILTVADKRRAIKGKYRISEDLLLTVALIGGSVGEYLTMKAVHHKTKHKRFMIGLPLIILLHIAAAILVLYVSNFKRFKRTSFFTKLYR